MQALRCLKRHLARRIWQLLRAGAPTPDRDDHTHMTKTKNINTNGERARTGARVDIDGMFLARGSVLADV
jgi:hypothetical protein